MRFTISLPKRLGLFVLVAFLCFVITSLLIGFVIKIFGMTEPSTRILAVIQDLVLFMLPALVTAMLITRLPATFLMIDRRPELKLLMWGLLALVFSIPAMETIIAWNNQIQLPPALEEQLRQAEMQAQQMIEVMLGGHNVGSLVMGILLVGMLAPLAEELFFRGCLQRLFTTGGMNIHLAVWSRSLWVPVLMHALNNTLYVIGRYITQTNSSLSLPETTALTTGTLLIAAASLLLTAACLVMMYRHRVRIAPAAGPEFCSVEKNV